jgi:MFS family permease
MVLGRRASLCVSAGVVAHTLWTSAAPAMVYRLYAADWQLSHTVTAGIFAIYPIVVVAVLIGFGGISDHIGVRAAMLMGLGASLAGTLLFAVAPGVTWLFLARALMGIGVGLSAGPSTAAVVEFSVGGAKRAALITTVAQAGGFAAALLLGGALVQYAPWPTRLSFWVLAALLALLFATAWFLPRNANAGGGCWRPRAPSIPKDVRAAFTLASLALMTAYTHGVLVLSLGGQVAHDLVGTSNALVGGATLSLFAIVFGATSIVGKFLPPRIGLITGALASATGMALLALAVQRHDLPIFLLATSTAGAGYSLLFLSGLEVINAAAPAAQRGGVLSALYLLSYLSMGATAIVLGTVATAGSLGLAVDLGACIIAVLSLATMILAASGRGLGSPYIK